MAKSGQVTTRQAKNSQTANDSSNMPMSVPDLVQHDAFLDAIKNAVKQAVREEMKSLRQELSMVSTQIELNESRILSLEVSNDMKTKEIDEIGRKLTLQNEHIHALESKVQDAEQYSRRNCLRIFGIPETKGEKTDDIVRNLAKEKLGIEIDVADIDRSHRTGFMRTSDRSASSTSSQHPSSASSSNHHRPIIVKFATYRSRQVVLKSRRKLKQSGISIAEDLTATNYKLLRTARQSKNVTAAWSLDGRIYVTTVGKSDRKQVKSIEEALKL